ncbi:hypothetical protein ACYF6T_28320 [Streptomyces sp. 7R007]
MAKTIVVLEEAGLVTRTQDPNDGRRQLVSWIEPCRNRD